MRQSRDYISFTHLNALSQVSSCGSIPTAYKAQHRLGHVTSPQLIADLASVLRT